MIRTIPSWRLLLLPVLALALFGCGDDVPKTADQAVLRVVNGLAENKPEVAWQAMPASYQKDVHDLVHTAVAKVDPTLWNKSFSMAQRIVKILREKKQFILKHDAVGKSKEQAAAMGFGDLNIDAIYDSVVKILDAIVNSEIATHEKAVTLDVGAFLDRTGTKVMENVEELATKLQSEDGKGKGKEMVDVYEKAKKTTATLVKEEGDTATVKIEAPGEEPEEEQFVRVEGKWIPKEMKEEWPEMIAEAKKELDAVTKEQMDEAKTMGLEMLKQLEKAIGPVEKASTQAEFDEAIGKLFYSLNPAGGPTPPTPPSDDE